MNMFFKATYEFFDIITLEMPRTCCVGDCRTNYDNENETIKVHSFPGNDTERERGVRF